MVINFHRRLSRPVLQVMTYITSAGLRERHHVFAEIFNPYEAGRPFFQCTCSGQISTEEILADWYSMCPSRPASFVPLRVLKREEATNLIDLVQQEAKARGRWKGLRRSTQQSQL